MKQQRSAIVQALITFLLLAVPAALPAAVNDNPFPPREPRYQLHTSDVISISYRYTPEFNTTATIQPDGFVNLPLLGDIKLVGQTLSQARAAVITKANEQLNNPEVSVQIDVFEKPYYVVGGHVGSPGKFEYHGPITALRAVEIAGGFRDSGKTTQILLIRPINQVDAETKLINLKDVLTRRSIGEDVQLQAGDMLIVPQNRLSKVERIVRLTNIGAYVPIYK